jgi:spermidine synthase
VRIASAHRPVLQICAFLVGFASLVYEVYGAKVLFLYVVETTHAVAILLSAFLAGLAVSSLVVARHAAERHARRWLSGLQIAAAVYAFSILQRHDLIPRAFDGVHGAVGNESVADALSLVIAWIYLFFPGFFMGGAFPLLTSLAAPSETSTIRNVGEVYFWDTCGAIAGALVCGFLLLPWLGL